MHEPMITHLVLLHIGILFQFEQSNYTVSEAGGSLVVCVQLVSGNLSQQVNVTIRSQDGTATGRNHPVHKTVFCHDHLLSGRICMKSIGKQRV